MIEYLGEEKVMSIRIPKDTDPEQDRPLGSGSSCTTQNWISIQEAKITKKEKGNKVLPNNRPKQESNLIHLLLLFLAKVYIFKGDYQEDLNRL